MPSAQEVEYPLHLPRSIIFQLTPKKWTKNKEFLQEFFQNISEHFFLRRLFVFECVQNILTENSSKLPSPKNKNSGTTSKQTQKRGKN